MDSATPREKAVLSISIKAGRNWRNVKGDPLQPCVVRCEYGDGNVLGESPKFTPGVDATVEVDFTTSITLERDPASWNQMVNTPLLISLLETSLKESKKKRSPSFNKIGVATVDLLPVLWPPAPDETAVEGVSQDSWFAFFPPDRLLPDAERRMLRAPEVLVGFEPSVPLIPTELVGELNMLTLSLDSYYGIPERMQETWESHEYHTAMFLPTTERDEILFYEKSICHEASPHWTRKYWYGRTGGNADDDFIPSVQDTAGDDESTADFRGDQVDFSAMHDDKRRVTVNTEKRFILTREAMANFEEYVSRCKVLPVELLIRRSKQEKGPAKNRRKTSDDLISFHFGMASVDLSYLLCPGMNRVRGAYRLQCLDPEKYGSLTGGRRSVFLMASSRDDDAPPSAPTSKRSGDVERAYKEEKSKKKDGAENEKAKEKATTNIPQNLLSFNFAAPKNLPLSEEDDVFHDGTMYIVLDIRTRDPLVKSHTPEQLAMKVDALIPKRIDNPAEARSAAEAEYRYHKKVKEISQMLLEQLRTNKEKYAAEASTSSIPLSEEEIWQRFAFDMNTSGKYFTIKETLKPAIIEVVREKYLKHTSFVTEEEVEDFLSQLYVYLVTEMHAALNQFLDAEEDPLVVPSTVDNATLRAFAEVAQQLGKRKKAQQYYLERLARERTNSLYWCEYGEFCLSVGNIDVAEGCFREVLYHNPRSAIGLLMLGICASLRQDPEQASSCLEYALCMRRECFLTQAILGIHLERMNDTIGAEVAYKSAMRLLIRAMRHNQVQIVMEYYDSYYLDIECCPVPPEMTPLEDQVSKAENAAKEAAKQQPTPDMILLQNEETRSQAETEDVEKRKKKSGRRDSRAVSSRLGKPRSDKSDGYKSEEKKDTQEGAHEADLAKEQKEHLLENDKAHSSVMWNKLYLLVAQFLLKHKAYNFAEQAVSRVLLTSGQQLSAEYYCTAAQLNFLLGDVSTANDLVHEAQKYYYRDPQLWSLLGHVYYCSRDSPTALRCYETLVDLGEEPDDMHVVHMFMGEIYYSCEQYRRARTSFLLAVKALASPFSWLWLGKACYRLSHYGEAEEALRESNLLDNNCGETWAYLSLVSLLADQRVLAEQAYKYALKLGGLSDELLGEIHELQKEKGFGDPGFQSSWWSKQYLPTE